MSRHTRPHDHAWIVSPSMLDDEPVRRHWVAHVRRELAPTGRIRFRRVQPNVFGQVHGWGPVTMVWVLGCVTDHGGPR